MIQSDLDPVKRMKSLFKILYVLFIIQSCSSSLEKTDSYTIHGKIDGIEHGEVILAKLDLSTNERVDVDSAEIKNGEFSFKGQVESPYLHTLFFNKNRDKIHFFLENSEIHISGNMDDLEHAKISGSREDSLFHSYELDEIYYREEGMEIMLKYPDYCFSAFTAYYQFQIHNIPVDTMEMIMKGYKDPVTKSVYYEYLNNLYDRLKKVAISQPAPSFSLPDTTGKTIKLDDFKGKYVLIDFWASWCAPCRAANPELIEIYRQFSDKNFTVVGISVDRDEEQWKKAIESDQLPWTNVSSLSGWDAISETYGVEAIPQNFLLNTSGIIIDKNIEPAQLIERLDALLNE
jgi:peroxiredoxin